MPTTTKTSWKVATTAATPNLNSNLHATYMSMPIIETKTAQSASRWSFFPTVGPTSLVESIVKGLAGIPSVKAAPSEAVRAPRFSSLLLSFTRSLFCSANCWRFASLKPLSASISRTSWISIASANLYCIAMPPAKSVPRFALPVGIAMTATRPKEGE